MQAAMGAYDLVVSTKPYHPANWRSTYGYDNPCVFVPHGYDPGLHLRESPPEAPDYDVVLVAAGRPEYYELVRGLAEQLADTPLRVGIGGNAWGPLAASLPAGWDILGPKFGPEYIDLLRRGSIVIAPVQRHVRIRGTVQPGDEDTARTYEIAAAYCFFIHQRTDFAAELYDEHAEVPLFGSAAELAKQIRFYLQHDDLRRRMAAAAHARAVPGFALDARAHEIVGHLTQLLARRRSLRS
jgi:glycosyltransferase involved in cell wall biosynthesis